jgi:lysophospholipase L1-like esterase
MFCNHYKWIIRLTAASTILAVVLATPLLGIKSSSETVNWTDPATIAFQKVATKIDGSASDQPHYLTNLNCVHYTFRYRGSDTMQEGCFMTTAFGSMDIDSHAVIFNGTDEAIRVEPSGNGYLLPLPHSAVVASLSPAPLAGAYLNLYTYFPRVLSDIWNYAHLNVEYKQVSGPANLHITDSHAQSLAVNPQSIAYSNNGAWMVLESPWHSFMRINLATLEATPFAASFNIFNYDSQMHTSQVSISDDGRYVGVQSDEYQSFKVYDLTSCTGSQTDDLKPFTCATHDYQQYIRNLVPGYSHITKIRFLNDSLMSVNASYAEGTGVSATSATDTYLLSPNGQIGSLAHYVALGDSYTAGEGSFNYVAGTDLPYNRCHLSVHSYPFLLSQDIFHGDGHSAACSGARIHDIDDTSGGYPGQVTGGIARKTRTVDSVNAIINEYNPGYIAQYEIAAHYQPKVLTVSAGGNDMGFADIMKACALPSIKTSTCYDTFEDRQEVMQTIDSQLKPLVSLYKMLQESTPTSAVYVIGYPQIVFGGGSCALNVHLDAKEIEFSQEVTEYMNGVIQQAAAAAGVQYVDISKALSGHRLCESKSYDVAVNGLTAGTDDGPWGTKVFGSESYHPTALGQELIEQAILAKTKNFTLPSVHGDPSKGTPSVPPIHMPILDAPKTGRATHTVIPGHNITESSTTGGKTIKVKVSGATTGFQPKTKGIISIGGVVVGTFTTDEDGNIDQIITVPPLQSPGFQPITVTGGGSTGGPVDITEPIYIGGSGTDANSDNIPDTKDSCLGVINSGQDEDGDGIDDACDGMIGEPPGNGGGTAGTNTGTGSTGGSTPINPGAGTSPNTGTGSSTAGVGTYVPPINNVPGTLPSDQGSPTVPITVANGINTDVNAGSYMAVAAFGSAGEDRSQAIVLSSVPASTVAAQFKAPVSQTGSVPLGAISNPARGLATPQNLPQAPLENIGSVIGMPFHLFHLPAWWWQVVAFMVILICLVLGIRRRFIKRKLVINNHISQVPPALGQRITYPAGNAAEPLVQARLRRPQAVDIIN